MTINIIVAVSDNGVIGKDGKIPWKLSTDLARFKEITTGHTVVMGRKTFHSIGDFLKERKNYIISRSSFEDPENPLWLGKESYISPYMDDPVFAGTSRGWFRGLEEFLEFDKSLYKHETFIIGGQQIYDEIFKTPELIHRVYLTRVHCNVEGDAFFPHADLFGPKGLGLPHDSEICIWGSGHNTIRYKAVHTEFIPKSDKDEYDSTFQVWENRS